MFVRESLPKNRNKRERREKKAAERRTKTKGGWEGRREGEMKFMKDKLLEAGIPSLHLGVCPMATDTVTALSHHDWQGISGNIGDIRVSLATA